MKPSARPTRAMFVLAATAAGLIPPLSLSAQEPVPALADSGVVVKGRVFDGQSGDAIGAASVSLEPVPPGGVARRKEADGAGHFTFPAVPPGEYRLSVVGPGYRELTITLAVADVGLRLALPLATGRTMQELVVIDTIGPGPDRASALPEVDPGSRSPFIITRAEIRDRRPERISDLLAPVPGVRLVAGSGSGSVPLLRGDCRPVLWVDGFRLPHAGGFDEILSPTEVEVIRVYHGLDLPAEYGSNTCGGVVVRTRQGSRGSDTGSEPMGYVRQAAAAAGVLLLLFLLAR